MQYKEGKATNEKEKAEVVELKAAIAGIQEAKAVSPQPKESAKKSKSKPEADTSAPSPELQNEVPSTPPKGKKELKEEEAKREAASIEAIANIGLAYQLKNTKSFPQSDQDSFADKATPEQKAKLSAVIGRGIEILGADSPERENLLNLHESLIGQKYIVPKKPKASPVEPVPSP